MNELTMVGYMAASGALFALGGYKWKGWRRWIFPVLTLVILWSCGVLLWKAILASGLLMAALHLGYGESHPMWPDKIMVALSYSVPSLVIGLTLWQMIVPITFLAMFAASNSFMRKDFQWKIVEFITGFMIATTFITALG